VSALELAQVLVLVLAQLIMIPAYFSWSSFPENTTSTTIQICLRFIG
jgi:hypothetical protein